MIIGSQEAFDAIGKIEKQMMKNYSSVLSQECNVGQHKLCKGCPCVCHKE